MSAMNFYHRNGSGRARHPVNPLIKDVRIMIMGKITKTQRTLSAASRLASSNEVGFFTAAAAAIFWRRADDGLYNSRSPPTETRRKDLVVSSKLPFHCPFQ